MSTFADIVADARLHAGMTDAEFDYSLAHDAAQSSRARAALYDACYRMANPDVPDTTTTLEELDAREERADALHQRHAADIAAMADAAREKTYAGWSNAHGGPIRYGR